MGRYLKAILVLGLIVPACDAFVCSQERIKAIEIANRGVEAFKNNLYDSAERELRLSIQTDPSYEMAYYNLGKVYQKQRKWDKAIEAFEGAAQKSPSNANFQYDLGEAYLRRSTWTRRRLRSRRRPSWTPSSSKPSGVLGWCTSIKSVPRRQTWLCATPSISIPGWTSRSSLLAGSIWTSMRTRKPSRSLRNACGPTRTALSATTSMVWRSSHSSGTSKLCLSSRRRSTRTATIRCPVQLRHDLRRMV